MMGFFDDAISTIGRGLAETAANAIGEQTGVDLGGTVAYLFGGGQTAGGAALQNAEAKVAKSNLPPDAIATVVATLDGQRQTLSDIGVQLTSVSQTLRSFTEDFAQIENELAKIQQQQLFQNWQTVDMTITPFATAITTSYQTYSSYLADFENTQPSDVSLLMTNIKDTNVGPADGVTAINALILGQDQATGVLQLWSEMVTPLIQQGLLDYRDAVQQYTRYYQKLAYAQLCATNLLMEAYNFTVDPDHACEAWKNYKQAIASQETPFIQSLIPLVAASATVVHNDYTFTAAHGALQLNPGVQLLPGNGTSVFYEPSPVFEAAESFLANLAVTDPADRRIVVCMLYQGSFIGTIVSPAQLTLSAGGTTVSASSETILGPYSYPAPDSPYLDYNFCTAGSSGTFFVKRFVFSGEALADGAYTLTNLNGTNGLTPQDTYLSSASNEAAPAFMNDDITAYGLAISGAQPFDFMNFMAYDTPVSGLGYLRG
jgi:hypothetical protein